MSDLISISALIEEFEIQRLIKEDRLFTIPQINALIKNAPTVDAVPVVRCKDCVLMQFCKIAQYLGPDGYCSNADMRGEKNANIL